MNKKIRCMLLALSLIVAQGCAASAGKAENPVKDTVQASVPVPVSVTEDVYTGIEQPPHFNPDPLPTAAPQPQGIIPARIEIPAIGVDAVVLRVGMLDNGQMDVPKDDTKVGWFEPGYEPGAIGNSVIAGHVDNYKGPAVFFYLKKLKAGDQVFVTDESGKKLTFAVKEVTAYKTAEAPLEQIFGHTDKSNLNLITCTGVFNRKTQESEKRLVVYTELVP